MGSEVNIFAATERLAEFSAQCFRGERERALDQLSSIFYWFSGGATQYHNLRMCMQGDTPWIALTVSLDALVGAGYAVIAYHWWKNQRMLAAGMTRAPSCKYAEHFSCSAGCAGICLFR